MEAPEHGGTKRRRLLPEERRAEIIAAATDLISATGFNATTIDDFARAAGISRPGLLHHFPTKEALLEAVLTRRDNDTVEALRGDAASDAVEARALLTALVAFNQERRPLVQLYAILAAESLSPDHPAHAYFRTRQRQAEELFSEKIFSWHSDPLGTSRQAIAHLDGLQLAWLRDPSIDIVDHWENFATRFLF